MILEITIAYIIGILGGLYKNIIFIVPFFMLILFILYKLGKLKISKGLLIKKVIISFIFFIIGFTYSTTLEDSYENKYKDEEEIQIVATIISNKKEKSNSIAYEIKVESGKYAKTRLILYIKKSNSIEFEYGDKVFIKGTYKEPNIARNYKGFSYKEYLKTQMIYGTISATKSDVKLIKKNNVNIISKFANFLSTKIEEKVEKNFENNEAGLLLGILLGNKDNLDDNIEQNFKDSNLSHMLAVSGAHVSYLILGITFLLNKVKFGKKISKIITIILLLFFILLVGGTPSVTRACLMAIYLIIGTLIYKKPDIKSSICISLMIILIKNPYSIFDIGLELSYGGTIGIILFANRFLKNEIIKEDLKDNIKGDLKNEIQENKDNQSNAKKENIEIKQNYEGTIKKAISYIKQMALISICANIIIVPIMAYHFSTVSITFIISNILAGPILGVVVILGFIYCICSFIFEPISIILSFILNFFLKILIQIASFCSNIPFSKIYVKTPSIFLIIIYYTFVLLIFKYGFKNIILKIKGFGYKKIISIILLVLIIFQIIKFVPKDLKIYFIDVGQGDSTLIVTPYGKTILIDGGGSSSSNFDVGEQTLVPYLLDRGITKVDYCIVSHFDTDHVRTDF